MSKRSDTRWIWISSILVAVCIASVMAPFLLRTYVIQAFKIPSGAMKPTLLVGDHILVDKRPGVSETIERGDILVFVYPVDPKKDFVKRAIGLPGDLIEMKNKQVRKYEAFLQWTMVVLGALAVSLLALTLVLLELAG